MVLGHLKKLGRACIGDAVRDGKFSSEAYPE